MPTQFDSTFRSLSSALIARFGVTTATYNQSSPGVIDDDTSTVVKGELIKTLPMSPPLRYKRRDIDGDLIRADDTFVIISAPDWEASFSGTPKSGDEIVINGLTLAVVNDYSPIYSGELVAAYKIQLRRGHA